VERERFVEKRTRMSVWVGNLFWPDLARNDKGHTKGGGQTGGNPARWGEMCADGEENPQVTGPAISRKLKAKREMAECRIATCFKYIFGIFLWLSSFCCRKRRVVGKNSAEDTFCAVVGKKKNKKISV